MILHIISRKEWVSLQSKTQYEGNTLHTEGFIHCSEISQVVGTANKHFRQEEDLLALCIDPQKVTAEVRFEDLYGDEQEFPHIYGPLNLDAVTTTFELKKDENGHYLLPEGLKDYI